MVLLLGRLREVLLALAEVADALLVGRLDLGLLPFGEALVAVLGGLSGMGGIRRRAGVPDHRPCPVLTTRAPPTQITQVTRV